MSVESAIHTLLAADAGVIALVPAARIYDDTGPQNPTVPYITVFRVDSPHEHHMGGSAGLTHPRIQIDIYAANSVSRFNIREAVRDALDGYRGTSDSVQIRKCFLTSDQSAYTPPASGEQFGIYRAILDFAVSHFESVPTF